MVKDWKAIAKANGLELTARDLDRVVSPLDNLEGIFRPLVDGLTPDVEPSFVLPAEENE